MAIRFKCPNCKKTLGVKDHLAGRKALCPACRKSLVIPSLQDAPADVEDIAAKLLGDAPAPAPKPEPVAQLIKFQCEYCDAEVEKPLAEAGTKTPCPQCKRIIRIPTPKVDKPKDWRDIAKKGPSAALVNQPEELENAWGSNQQKNVSASAMSEAGAVEEEAEPIILADWFRRGFWTLVLLGLATLVYFFVPRLLVTKNTIETALEAIEENPKKPARIKLSPLWSAEIHRAAGEFYCCQRLAEKAREQLQKARAHAIRPDKKAAASDVDRFLIELALTQFELGGSEEEVILKERIYWPEARTELAPTLEAISEPYARSLGLRLVVSRLVEIQQADLAIELAGQLSSKSDRVLPKPKHVSCLKAQQAALLFAQNSEESKAQAKELLPFPQPEKKEPIDSLARTAFVEGFVRLGKFQEALDLANAKSEAPDPNETLHRLEACVVAATVLTDPCRAKASPRDALPFVSSALKLVKEKDLPNPIPPWILYQLIQAGLRTDEANAVKELAKSLDPAFQAYVQLDEFRLKLAKDSRILSVSDVDLLLKLDSFVSAMTYESLARQNTRLGQSREDLMNLVRLTDDDPNRPFVFVGMALGESERKK